MDDPNYLEYGKQTQLVIKLKDNISLGSDIIVIFVKRINEKLKYLIELNYESNIIINKINKNNKR